MFTQGDIIMSSWPNFARFTHGARLIAYHRPPPSQIELQLSCCGKSGVVGILYGMGIWPIRGRPRPNKRCYCNSRYCCNSRSSARSYYWNFKSQQVLLRNSRCYAIVAIPATVALEYGAAIITSSPHRCCYAIVAIPAKVAPVYGAAIGTSSPNSGWSQVHFPATVPKPQVKSHPTPGRACSIAADHLQQYMHICILAKQSTKPTHIYYHSIRSTVLRP